MKSINELLIDIIDDAFDQVGWQGSMNLVNTVESLTLEQLTYTPPAGGYCAWQIVLHCVYCKWVVASFLSGYTLDDFPRKVLEEFPVLPDELTEENWQKDFQLLIDYHTLVKKAILVFPEERWWEVTPPPRDPLTYIKRVYGLAAHDVYHTAHIRNMGIPDLK